MDTDSLDLALLKENLEDFSLPEKKNEWEALLSRDCTDGFIANASNNFFKQHVVLLTGSMIRKSRDYLKKKSGVRK